MSQGSATFPNSSASLAPASASEAEKHARLAGEASPPRAPKPRSCVTCRSRKVRCDKKTPCSNCRRANISCVLPSADRQPRWARRLQQGPSGDVMNRLRSLENLVKHLSSQLDEANAAAVSATGDSPGVSLPGSSNNAAAGTDHRAPSANSGKMESQFGRLIFEDANHSRYVGSGFWSRVNDEVCIFKLKKEYQ